MQKRKNFLYIFLLFLFLSVLLLISSRIGLSKGFSSAVSSIFSPFQSISYSALSSINIFGNNAQIEKLKTENQNLTQKLVDQKKLIDDNKALRDQFETQSLNNLQLLPARIIGSPSFIPGLSSPETFTLDQGEANGVKVGDAVIYKNILVGRIDKTQSFVSRTILITNSVSSFTAKTMGSSNLGVIKGQGGGEMILDNVLLSENLTKDELVLTKGDLDTNETGFPPDLIIGKIKSINKNPSALFQKAEVESPIDFENLSEVFIILGLSK
jgi:rod shape-determining protein MreC